MNNMIRAIIVMGVSGCGKSTVGNALAARLGWQFADADQYHPQANVDKMRAGQALDDTDREPWLKRLNQLLKDAVANNHPTVLACSALKQVYRDTLTEGIATASQFVHLSGSFELIEQRMNARHHQYMPSSLLQSQFALLEPPANAWVVDITKSSDIIVREIANNLML
jgi:carbohydrate kinase (thermoresistant glucokinase family)